MRGDVHIICHLWYSGTNLAQDMTFWTTLREAGVVSRYTFTGRCGKYREMYVSEHIARRRTIGNLSLIIATCLPPRGVQKRDILGEQNICKIMLGTCYFWALRRFGSHA